MTQLQPQSFVLKCFLTVEDAFSTSTVVEYEVSTLGDEVREYAVEGGIFVSERFSRFTDWWWFDSAAFFRVDVGVVLS